jgi:uncharacterized protein YcaQ
MTATLSNREARWLALFAQGLGGRRGAGSTRRPGPGALERLLGRIGAIQLDAVNVVCRTQFLVPFSRLGPYDRDLLLKLSGPGRPWFEHWGHAASLMPVSRYPLFRPRMARFADDGVGASSRQRSRAGWRRANAPYLRAVLAEVTERGPLAASQLSDPRRQRGTWWDRRSHGRRALELLFGEGVLAAWRSESFERVYDLAERVIPAEVLAAPVPDEDDAERELLAVAARCLGVGSAADLAAYFSVPPATSARRRVGELVEAGRLIEVAVEGWAQPAYVLAKPRPQAPRRDGVTLLSPFDSLIWTRQRTERLFGFGYRIEIYVPGPERTHGYYVLPMLMGDRMVGRVDLKADRGTSALLVQAAHAERGEDPAEVAEAASIELTDLAGWLGLDSVRVVRRGNLASSLHGALGAPR